MPIISIEQLDESPAWDVSPAFGGGMVSNSRANLLQANQCSYIQNMDLNVSGELITRRGTKALGGNLRQQVTGLAYYKTPTNTELVLTASSSIGNTVYVFDGNDWTLANSQYQILPDGPVTFVQGIDKLFIGQEQQPLKYFESDLVHAYDSTGVTEITLLQLPSGIPDVNGKYFTIADADGDVYVWFNIAGMTADPAPSGYPRGVEVDLPSNYQSLHRKTVAIAIADALTADGAWSAALYAGTGVLITDAASGRRTDATLGTIASLGITLEVNQQGENENLAPPTGLQYLAWHTSRLVGAGNEDNPDTVYFSEFLDGSTWDRTLWSLRVGGGEGDPITGLASWTAYNLVVFKEHSTWVIDCNPTQDVAEFVIHRVHDRIGCPAWRTAAQVGTDIFFLSDSGVRSIKNILASEQQKEVGPALSYPVEDYIKRITPTAISTSCGFHWENRYILAVPLDGASQPNTVLVYNTITEGWTVWTGLRPTQFAGRIDAGVKKLWFGQSDGRVVDWMDYIPENQASDTAFEDCGDPIESVVTTKAFTCSEPICTKNGLNAVLEFNKSFASVESVAIRDTGTEEIFEAFDTAAESIKLPVMLPFTLPRSGAVRKPFDTARYDRWNELQFKLVAPSKKLAIRSIALSAFVNPLSIQ